MKRKLLCIWILLVLIMAVVYIIFINKRETEFDKNVELNMEPEQKILPYHWVGEDEIWWQYLPLSECYNEEWYIDDSPDIDMYGNAVNCFDMNGNMHGRWLYSRDWQVISNLDTEKVTVIMNYKNWEEPDNRQADEFQIIADYKKDIWSYIDRGKNIEIVSYYENWQIASKWQVNDWEIEWKHILYYNNWQIAIEIEFKNWMENWKYVTYYRNWNINEEWEFLNWEKHWKWITYYGDNWQIFSKWDMLNWQENWEYVSYNHEWNINEEWEFLNWEKHWKWLSYYVDGGIINSGVYVNWLQNGEWLSYYSNWLLKSRSLFSNWKLEESIRYD